jgi:hydrogenase/urease accessory protein HupE
MTEQSGWVLMDEPPHLTGEKPELVRYLSLGFNHVLSGWDHLAFVLGLVILARRFSSLAWLITSFTIAHSITLAMAAMDVFVLPQALTEMLIAVSIIYIGLENLWVLYRGNWRIPNELSMSRRMGVSFMFGLIHGFGFSFLLREMGLPPTTLLQSLVLFNIGVELAQLCVVIIPFVILQRLLSGTIIFSISSSVISVAVFSFGVYLAFERFIL